MDSGVAEASEALRPAELPPYPALLACRRIRGKGRAWPRRHTRLAGMGAPGAIEAHCPGALDASRNPHWSQRVVGASRVNVDAPSRRPPQWPRIARNSRSRSEPRGIDCAAARDRRPADALANQLRPGDQAPLTSRDLRHANRCKVRPRGGRGLRQFGHGDEDRPQTRADQGVIATKALRVALEERDDGAVEVVGALEVREMGGVGDLDPFGAGDTVGDRRRSGVDARLIECSGDDDRPRRSGSSPARVVVASETRGCPLTDARCRFGRRAVASVHVTGRRCRSTIRWW